MRTPDELGRRLSEQTTEYDEIARYAGQLAQHATAAVEIFGAEFIDHYNLRMAAWTERQWVQLQRITTFQARTTKLSALSRAKRRVELLRWLKDSEALIVQNERHILMGRTLIREVAPKMALVITNPEP